MPTSNNFNLQIDQDQLWIRVSLIVSLPGVNIGKEPACQCKRHRDVGSTPGWGRFPWRSAWQPTPVFLLEYPHEPEGLQSIGSKESDTTEAPKHTCTHKCWYPFHLLFVILIALIFFYFCISLSFMLLLVYTMYYVKCWGLGREWDKL